uniref:ATP-dependent DNA helicase n=1 Tax=Globodera pallida TaxID=36090 RepID=A0A183BU32_GLOPA
MDANIKAPTKPVPPIQPPAEEPQPSTSGTQNAAPLPTRHIILDQDEPLSKGAKVSGERLIISPQRRCFSGDEEQFDLKKLLSPVEVWAIFLRIYVFCRSKFTSGDAFIERCKCLHNTNYITCAYSFYPKTGKRYAGTLFDSANMEVDEIGQLPLEESLEQIDAQDLEPDEDVTAQNDLIASTQQELNNDLGEQGCGVQHPGFCMLCSRLYKLQATGLQEQKVYMPCCQAYCHLDCKIVLVQLLNSPMCKLKKEELVKAVISGVIGLLLDASSFFLGAKTQQQSEPVSISRKRPKQTDDSAVFRPSPHNKPYEYDNIYSDNAYPRYRRRPPPPDEAAAKQNPEQYGRVFEYKDRWGRTICKDNAHVVAYNPYLSAKYRSHINVEFVAGDGCTKYICKYCMKGADMAFVEVKKDGDTTWDYDEFHQIRLARYITSAEAAMSLWGTPLVRRSHVVDQLDVHGPEGHLVAVDQSFPDEEERENAICEAAQREEERRATGEERVTQLTAYFAYNRDRSSADGPLHLTYATCYKKLRFDGTKRRWQAYVCDAREGQKLCRLKTVAPGQLELLAIRLLLLVVEDPTCWEDLRRHNGVVYPTFVTAAQARGLLSDNELWKRTIREAFDTKKTAKKCIRWLAVFFATANLTKPTELLDYGADMAFVEVKKDGDTTWDYDEYHQIRLARYITSAEAAMSLWGTPLVDQLDVHGPEGHLVAVDQSFADEEERENAICEAAQREEERRETGEERVTQLTAYFAYNRDRSSAEGPLHLTYATCYKKLRFDHTKRRWQPYVCDAREGQKLCRLKTVAPGQLELLAIRLLLLVVEDPTSWEDLRRNAGVVYPTFLAAAQARGLLSDNELWKRTIREAFDTKKSAKKCIRWLAVFFATANLTKPTDLLDYVMEIADQWLTVPRLANTSLDVKQQYVLRSLEWFLLANGVRPCPDKRPDGTYESACEHIGLPRPEGVALTKDDYLQLAFFRDDLINARIPEEMREDDEQHIGMKRRYEKLFNAGPNPNDEQHTLIEDIYKGVEAAHLLRRGSQSDATSATTRLFMVTGEGQTVHKRLCRAKHIDSSTPLNVDQESHFAEMLRNIDGMIIDEISMQHRDVLEYVDRLLRYVAPSDFLKSLPFAGKAVVIGGDWKQLTPVILGGGNLDQLDASVKNSILFKHFTTRRLVANHRLQAEPDREQLLKSTFPAELLKNPLDNWEELAGRAILCPLNRETFELNGSIMDQLETTERTYTGVTTPIVDIAGANELENAMADINIENLARMTPPGIPEHHLRVKVGSIMMINTNVSLEEGLCNGTRVQIRNLGKHILRCKILSGKHRGEEHDLHAARFLFGGDPKAPNEGLIKCERIQFPLRPGSVMTINKSQGQTLTHVGVLLDKSQCFSHGQLYTALSRVRDSANIRVCTKRADRRVRNVVMTELLDKEDLESAPEVDHNDPDDPYPRAPPKDGDSDDDDKPAPPAPPAFKTPTTRPRTSGCLCTPLQLPEGTNIDNLKKIKIVKGDITKQVVYMIVNDQRNEDNGAFLRACEPSSSEYIAALNAVLLPSVVPAPDGFVGVTATYGKLHSNVSYIAHAVAPIIQGATPTPANIQGLEACYRNALQAMADANKAESEQLPRKIAFPCVGTKAAGFPRDLAAKAAFEAILNWLVENPIDAELIDEIRLVPFDKSDAGLYRDVWAQIEAMDAEPCTSATGALPVNLQLYSQLSSSSVIASLFVHQSSAKKSTATPPRFGNDSLDFSTFFWEINNFFQEHTLEAARNSCTACEDN